MHVQFRQCAVNKLLETGINVYVVPYSHHSKFYMLQWYIFLITKLKLLKKSNISVDEENHPIAYTLYHLVSIFTHILGNLFSACTSQANNATYIYVCMYACVYMWVFMLIDV